MTGPGANRSLVKQALLALEQTQQRLRALEQRGREPLAVVGMGCRFPGGADGGDAFWKLLRDGGDAMGGVPPERWDVESFYHPEPGTPGRMYSRAGAFLDAVDGFDAAFFGISPREAEYVDPQHRLLLEVCWEALESAGIAPASLAGSATGLFVGISSQDYASLQIRAADPERIGAYLGSGTSPSAAAGRVAYQLGLAGPTLAVDTACSSSLVAVHLACQSLRTGACERALVGGVQLMLSPEPYINLAQARMLSPSGRCHTFDAGADGYARGEGCGVIVLERLSTARAARHRVLALVRGSAVNHDGRTAGLHVPNGPAQEALIRAALADAGIEPGAVSYVEAHGTGTSLGDPIEVLSLAAVYARDRPPGQALRLGAVKTNIGHLEAAAGIAGLIKTVLQLQAREIPPHPHLGQLNPHIPWAELPFEVPRARQPWNPPGPRVAGVSAFGFVGTNAHVVLQEADDAPEAGVVSGDDGWDGHALCLSARTEPALRQMAARLARHLGSAPDLTLGDVGHTLLAGRSHFEQRLTIVTGERAEALAALQAFGAGGSSPRARHAQVPLSERASVAFVYPRAQSELSRLTAALSRQPAFAEAVGRCAELRRTLDLAGGDDLDLFAFQHALTCLWRAWGVEPDFVLGDGGGEIAAAWACGGLDLAAALRLAAGLDPAPPGEGASVEARRPGCVWIDGHDGRPVALDRLSRDDWRARRRQAGQLEQGRRALDALGCRATLELRVEAARAWMDLAERAAELYRAGVALGREGFDGRRVPVELPTYPFQRERAWIAGLPRPTAVKPDSDAFGRRFLLGERVLAPGLRQALFSARWDPRTPSLADHVVQERIVVSGPTEAALLLAAATDAFSRASWRLARLEFREAFILPEGEPRAVRLLLDPPEQPEAEVSVSSCAAGAAHDPGAWRTHVTGGLRALDAAARRRVDLDEVRRRCPRARTAEAFYDQVMAELGFRFGPSYRCVEALWAGEGEVLGRLRLPAGAPPFDGPVHPALFDACFQLFAWPMARRADDTPVALAGASYVPFSIPRLDFHAACGAGPVWCHVQLKPSDEERPETHAGRFCLFDDQGQVLAEVEELYLKRADQSRLDRVQARQVGVRSWLHEVAWKPVAPHGAPAATSGAGELWLVFADAGDLGAQLARALEAAGMRVVRVDPGAAFERLDAARYRLRPAHAGDYAALLLALDLSASSPLAGVLHAWSLDAAAASGTSPASLEQAERLGCGSALLLIQALGRTPGAERARTFWLTSGAQATEPSSSSGLDAGQAPLWGLARVLATEQPELWGGVIDVEREATRAEAESIAALVLGAAGEDQLCLRRGEWFAPRLLPARPAPAAKPVELSADASFLITGGLGALGLRLAAWLVERGARELVLLGRSAPSAAARDVLAELERAGARVQVVRADVGSARDVQRVVARIEDSLPPLRGVFHAAAVLRDGALLRQDPADLAAVLAPKVRGAWNLHAATLHAELDFFVLFSSLAALLGNAGQAAYASANAFLDALALQRRRLGLPALTVNWGPWAGAGLAGSVSAAQRAAWERCGIRELPPAQALEAFELALTCGLPQVGVAAVDWKRYASQLGARRPSPLRDLAAAPGHAPGPAPEAVPGRGALLAELLRAPARRRVDLLREHLSARVRDALRLGGEQVIEPNRKLYDLGMDSLAALDLRTQLEREIGRRVPPTVVFEHPTVAALAAYLAEQIGLEPAPGEDPRPLPAEPAATAAPAALDAAAVQHLSEAQIAELIEREL